MGQRSQIYIRIHDEKDNTFLIAKYFQWNYGERMISRARYGIDYIKTNLKYLHFGDIREKISKFFDINFDMKDMVFSQDILEEVREGLWHDKGSENYYIFEAQDNNDGKLFIDCYQKTGEIKFCFTDYDFNILSPDEYMKWDMDKEWNVPNSRLYEFEDWDETATICEDNIKFINENAKMMTPTELEEFIKYDYSKQIGDSNFIKLLHDFDEKGIVKDNYFYFNIERTDANGSWKFYRNDTKEICMQYDNSTKKITAESPFKENYEGLIQDAYKYYNLPYEKQIIEQNLQINKEDEFEY